MFGRPQRGDQVAHLASPGAAMSNIGKFSNRTPAIAMAGLTSALAHESAAACLDYPQPPATPPHVKTWRKSLKHEPGKVVIHPGMMEDVQPNGLTYGRLNYKDASTSDLMNWEPTSETLAYQKAKQESIYASTKAEPLGQSMMRGHVLPDKTRDEKFAFGKNAVTTSGAKEALYPVENEDDEKGEAHTLYLRSHGSYNPGEQKRRNYLWETTAVNPTEHRFGVSEKMAMGGGSEEVMKALDPSLTMGDGTAIVPRVVEDYKNYAAAELGTCKNLGLDAGLSAGHEFGLAAQRAKEGDWGTAECMRGADSEKAQQPDKDLGTTLRPGWRNAVTEGDEERMFGVPGVRDDIAPPRVRSVADHQNYGDEPSAFTVMYPSKYAVGGVDEMDFSFPHAAQKLRTIIALAFPEVDDEEFSAVFEAAANGDDAVSVESWRAVYNGRAK